MVPKERLDILRTSNDLIILEELDIHLKYERYWWLSILVIPLIMISVSLNLINITEGACLGAILLLVLRSLSMHDAYESINWPVIFLIALLVPIGLAMEKTGTGDYVSMWIIDLSRVIGPTADIQAVRIISILYLITFISTMVVMVNGLNLQGHSLDFTNSS